MSKERFRYLDMDVTKTEQQEVILRLCKNNNFCLSDVWLHLRKTRPPGVPDALGTLFEEHMEDFIRTMSEWDMKGMIAVDGTVTENNPAGTSKVVGFLLYQIHRETKTELELLFTLVDETYRRRGHATNMVKACEALHLYPNKAGDNDLVKFFTAKVEKENTSALGFWEKLGYTQHVRPPPYDFHQTMFKGGPRCMVEKPQDTPTHVCTEMQVIKED
jgi:ribosomal protein S18 acetylase RimI-like enzyme